MDYRNKLGIFSFDDDTQESHMKLIVQTITGQYLNKKQGQPTLTDEESCYSYIREGCSNVLAGVGFDLKIHESERVWTPAQLREKKIKDFDARVQAAFDAEVERRREEVQEILDDQLRAIQTMKVAFPGSYLVGPAAVKS
jgi:hypothetical protein